MMYPPPKFIAQPNNTFGGLGDFLSANLLEVKNVITYYPTMENLGKCPDWEIIY
jgi:hypothetical protein